MRKDSMDTVLGDGRMPRWLAVAIAGVASLTVGVLLALVGLALVLRGLIGLEGLGLGTAALTVLGVLGICGASFVAFGVGLFVYPAVRVALRPPHRSVR